MPATDSTPTAPEPLTMSVAEAGRLLRLSRGSAYNAVRAGDIPTVSINGRLHVPRAKFFALFGLDSSQAG